MSHVVVNSRFSSRPITGVERYASEVTKRLGSKVKIIKPRRDRQGFQGHLWEQMILPFLMRDDEVLWSPANTGPLLVKNQIVTMHDISPLDHPEWYSPIFVAWYRLMMPRLAKQAKKIITDSDFSKQRILDRFNIRSEKVIVIPCGVDHTRFRTYSDEEIAKIKEKYDLPQTYLLAVGSLNPRKNLSTLFKAWEKIYDVSNAVQLVVVGTTGKAFRSLLLDNFPAQVRFLGFIQDYDLPLLYAGASCFIFPSSYEGFGLPVLEAMAVGVPVIASNATSIPEVIGDAGIQFNPMDVEKLASGIMQILNDDKLRREMIQSGLHRAKLFSWEKTRDHIWNELMASRAS